MCNFECVNGCFMCIKSIYLCIMYVCLYLNAIWSVLYTMCKVQCHNGKKKQKTSRTLLLKMLFKVNYYNSSYVMCICR